METRTSKTAPSRADPQVLLREALGLAVICAAIVAVFCLPGLA